MTDQTPAGLPQRTSREGNGLFLTAMILIGVALLVGGPASVLSGSRVMMGATVAVGLIGVLMVIGAAIWSYLNTPRH